MDLLRRMVEGYDEQKAMDAIALTVKDYWQDVIRAEQNRLVLQEEVAGIETHGETPCAVVYIGPIKGLIPVYEFGIDQDSCIKTKEDLKDEEKLKSSYQFLRNVTGQKVAFMIKGHVKKDNVFMASRKDGLAWMRKRTVGEVSVGDTILAVVRKVLPDRIYTDIGGMTATLAIAEYQHGWSENLTELVQTGDHMVVKCIAINEEKNTATISRKALIPDPWEKLDLLDQSEYIAEIMGIREDGNYFRVKTKNGYIDGFLRHPRHEKLTRGDKALVKIISIEKDRKRLFGLYLRPLTRD
jgi:ribosomal protein S1